MNQTYKKLGEQLIAQGSISSEQLEIALHLQSVSKKRLGEVLCEEGFVTEDTIAQCLATQYNYDVVDPDKVFPTEQALQILGWDIAGQQRLLPVSIDNDEIFCLVADPINVPITDELALRYRRRISLAVSPESKLISRIKQAYRLSGTSPANPQPMVPARFINALPRAQSGAMPWIDAFDSHLDRPVSLISMPLDASAKDQHFKQIKTCAAQTDPVLATVYDSVAVEQSRWTIFQPLPGVQLSETLRFHRPKPTSEAASIVASVAKAASLLKLEGFPWICPENIWISSEGLKVAPVFPVSDGYLFHSEVEALGNLLWHCLLGKHAPRLDFKSPAVDAIPTGMIHILQRCLSTNEDRFKTPADVHTALSAIKWTESLPQPSPTSLDRDELLSSLRVFTAPPKSNVWQRIFGRRAA